MAFVSARAALCQDWNKNCGTPLALVGCMTKSYLLIPLLAALTPLPAFTADDSPETSKKETSAETRKTMAEAHRKMADCLGSKKTVRECRKEMMKSMDKVHGHCCEDESDS